MSPESSADRLRKRVVELCVSGFHDANSAIRFGNTVESLVAEKISTFKYRQYIGSAETSIAITDQYTGDTVLKMNFLEVPGNEASLFIVSKTEEVIANHNDAHDENCALIDQVIRGKPQPQFIGAYNG